MRDRFNYYLNANTLKMRAARGTMLTIVGFGGQNILRLASNLILTRILFPEAFGLMAIVIVVQVGLAMFSDVGLRDAIVQDKRGSDPSFLNTAWTFQVCRGAVLWIVTILLAAPVAAFYDAPLLAQILPVAGLSALIQGFNSTRMMTADRDLQLGALTAMTLGAQLFGLLVLIALALWLQSVWALVLGGVVRTTTICILSHLVLPGIRNRFEFDREAAGRLFRFGKYIFFATIAGFLIGQSDRAILGKFVSLEELAVYNIGLLFATVPLLLVQTLSSKVIFPLYSRMPPAESEEARHKINTARRFLTGGGIIAAGGLAFLGDTLIQVLYDARYAAAGPIVVLLSLASMPTIISLSYQRLPTASGHSGRFASIVVSIALIKLFALIIGIQQFGLGGVVVAQGVASLLFYPILVILIRQYKGWDPLHDLVFFLMMVGIMVAVLWMHIDKIRPLFVPI